MSNGTRGEDTFLRKIMENPIASVRKSIDIREERYRRAAAAPPIVAAWMRTGDTP
jgi:hypothetical protein